MLQYLVETCGWITVAILVSDVNVFDGKLNVINDFSSLYIKNQLKMG